jgi:hypothetical protein
MRRRVGAAVLLLAGCVTSSGTRTLRPSAEEVMPASPTVVFQAALKAVTGQGLPLREANEAARVIQTDYVDVASFDPAGASQYPMPERLVRFRVLVGANPDGTGAVIAFFGIYSPFRVGIGTTERNERAIPRDHPAMAVVRKMRDDVAKSVGM